MAHESDPRLRVLHVLRLKGFADADVVAAVSEIDPAPLLTALDAAGLASHREGRVSGWSLTPAGRAEHAALLSAELKQSGAGDAVAAAYERFLTVNQQLLGVCTDWQMRPPPGGGEPAINDHADADYDKAVVARLREIDDAVQPVCAELSAALARFAGYGPRLGAAVDQVETGEPEWFTKPLIDSYHTVWFELHEDLLATLGIDRAKEGS